MSDLTSRMRPVFRGRRCVGHVLKHAKGFDAHDAENMLVGTFEKPRDAIHAVLASTTASNWGTH